ncbi:MAG TPA: hypothetical protein DCZ95_08395 [Verrucomicrobia bacterium]|nr:MAG: hypothetical protein A2X46_12430 [Lentisphaerae bacterium GWF2_57_35]HBA84098.1 hypothetical protein [Verrucomicrobiota bacterium]
MNIPQNTAVDKTNGLYSIDSILKPRIERAKLEEAAQERAPESLEQTVNASTTAASDSLPALGRFINVWA